MYNNKTKYIALGTAVAAAAIIFFSFILIPQFHAFGAALATILSFLIRFIIIYYYSQKEFPLSLPWGKCATTLSAATVLYLTSLAIQQESMVKSIISNSAIFGIYIAGLLALPIFTKREKVMIFNLVVHPIDSIRSRGM